MNQGGIGPKDTAQSAPGSSAAGWRESKWLALCELAIVVLIFIADWRHLIPFQQDSIYPAGRLDFSAAAQSRLANRRIRALSELDHHCGHWHCVWGSDGSFPTLRHSASPSAAYRKAARFVRFSYADRKSQTDAGRTCACVDSRGLRRGACVPRLPDEPYRRSGQSHAACLDLQRARSQRSVRVFPLVSGSDRPSRRGYRRTVARTYISAHRSQSVGPDHRSWRCGHNRSAANLLGQVSRYVTTHRRSRLPIRQGSTRSPKSSSSPTVSARAHFSLVS